MTCTALHDWVYQDTVDKVDLFACAHCGIPESDTVQEPDWDLLGKEREFD
jgi:hypothetical protein